METADEISSEDQDKKDYDDATQRLEAGESPDSVLSPKVVPSTKEEEIPPAGDDDKDKKGEVDPETENASEEKEPVPDTDELERLKSDNARLDKIAKDNQAGFTRKSQELAELKRKALVADMDSTKPEMLEEDSDLEASISHVVKREAAVRDIDKEIADSSASMKTEALAKEWGQAISDVHPDAQELMKDPDVSARMEIKFKEWNGDFSRPSLAIKEFNDIKAERADVAKTAAVEKAIADYKDKQTRLDKMKLVTGGTGANSSDDEADEVKKIRNMSKEDFYTMMNKVTS